MSESDVKWIKQLLSLMKDIQYGEIKIIMKAGEPVQFDSIKRDLVVK